MRRSLYDYCVENNRIELISQWDDAANLPQTPQTVSYSSHSDIHWYCEHGHRWQAKVYSRTTNRSGCPVCAGLVVISGENDLQTMFPEVAARWHPTKNMGDLPSEVGAFSHRKVWWQCEKCGHEWQAEIKSRVSGSGCPVCSGKTVVQGVNDLATLFPKLASEWHREKNVNLCAGDVSPGSRKKVWWRCEYGHEWQATVASRTQGSGCPVCTGKTVIPGVNDLKSRFPEIAEEWDREKNGSLTPDAVTEQSNRKVWWRCALGHSYQAVISSRTADRQGCPYCSGHRVLKGFNDLATVMPNVAAQWHPTKNGALTPEDVTCGSKKRVWWQCNVCGYEWKAVVYSRAGSQRCGCPMCAGKVRTNNLPRYRRVTMEFPHNAVNRAIDLGQRKTGTDPP